MNKIFSDILTDELVIFPEAALNFSFLVNLSPESIHTLVLPHSNIIISSFPDVPAESIELSEPELAFINMVVDFRRDPSAKPMRSAFCIDLAYVMGDVASILSKHQARVKVNGAIFVQFHKVQVVKLVPFFQRHHCLHLVHNRH